MYIWYNDEVKLFLCIMSYTFFPDENIYDVINFSHFRKHSMSWLMTATVTVLCDRSTKCTDPTCLTLCTLVPALPVPLLCSLTPTTLVTLSVGQTSFYSRESEAMQYFS